MIRRLNDRKGGYKKMKKEFIVPSLEVKMFNKSNLITLSENTGTDPVQGSNVDDATKSLTDANISVANIAVLTI
jgi:hypothetical protein